jgi:hypothetical protein
MWWTDNRGQPEPGRHSGSLRLARPTKGLQPQPKTVPRNAPLASQPNQTNVHKGAGASYQYKKNLNVASCVVESDNGAQPLGSQAVRYVRPRP